MYMKNYKLIVPAMILGVLLLSGFSGNKVTSENSKGSIMVNGLSRTYRMVKITQKLFSIQSKAEDIPGQVVINTWENGL